MKRLVAATIVGLLLGGAMPSADKRKKHKRHADVSHTSVNVHVAFGDSDVHIIRTHYASRLPKGLRKKYERTGHLPPGWQKKMEPLPVVIERELVVLPAGYRRGVIEGHAVIYNERSGVIIDVAVLF